MREIKCRAWDKRNKKWICPPSYTYGEMKIAGEIYEHIDYLVVGIPDMKNPNIEICQYTGLHDKGGKEIYEGDILKYKDRIFDIGWCNGGFKIMEMKSMLDGAVDGWFNEILGSCQCNGAIEEIEIIGNIYENPELLEAEYKQSEVK